MSEFNPQAVKFLLDNDVALPSATEVAQCYCGDFALPAYETYLNHPRVTAQGGPIVQHVRL